MLASQEAIFDRPFFQIKIRSQLKVTRALVMLSVQWGRRVNVGGAVDCGLIMKKLLPLMIKMVVILTYSGHTFMTATRYGQFCDPPPTPSTRINNARVSRSFL